MKKKAGLLLVVLCLTMLFSVPCFAGKYTGTKKGSGAIKMILVGDSRVMHMSSRSKKHTKNIYFVYGNGCSARDMNSNFDGFKTKLKNALTKYKKATVVFMLGVNGNSSPSKNIGQLSKAYNYFMKKYKGHTYIVSTVGKTFGCKGSYMNAHVTSLNKMIVSTFSGKVPVFNLYDLTSQWVRGKRQTRDGLHYKKDTYNRILDTLKRTYGIPR